MYYYTTPAAHEPSDTLGMLWCSDGGWIYGSLDYALDLVAIFH
jgi:hypothetical protein